MNDENKLEKKEISKAWVEKKHGIKSTANVLYLYYKEQGWI